MSSPAHYLVTNLPLKASKNFPHVFYLHVSNFLLTSVAHWHFKRKRERCTGDMIFCNTMNEIASVANHLFKLGVHAYDHKIKSPENCLLSIYHSNTWQTSKDRILGFIERKWSKANSCVYQCFVYGSKCSGHSQYNHLGSSMQYLRVAPGSWESWEGWIAVSCDCTLLWSANRSKWAGSIVQAF